MEEMGVKECINLIARDKSSDDCVGDAALRLGARDDGLD
jgi:hypothetical protein